MKNVKLCNASALFLLPLLSHIRFASTSSLFLNLLTFLTSRIKLYNPLKVILQVRLLRCWVQRGYLLTHTKESDDYTFIGIAYTYSSQFQGIGYVYIVCPFLPTTPSPYWACILECGRASELIWLPLDEGYCKTFRGLHCVATAALLPYFHRTTHWIANSNSAYLHWTHSASLSSLSSRTLHS